MARPKSDDKHLAILSAATAVFAERGLAASPTSAISKAAGVAEGTLFTYFATKDGLMNALYCHIKADIADHVLAGFDASANARGKLEHIWSRYVDWGVAHPQQHKVLAQLTLTDTITAASRAIGMQPFAEIEQLAKANIAAGVWRDYPVQFVGAGMGALADVTMAFMQRDPHHAATHSRNGFQLFWHGIALQESEERPAPPEPSPHRTRKTSP